MSSPGIGGDLFPRFDRLSGLKRMNAVETSESRVYPTHLFQRFQRGYHFSSFPICLSTYASVKINEFYILSCKLYSNGTGILKVRNSKAFSFRNIHYLRLIFLEIFRSFDLSSQNHGRNFTIQVDYVIYKWWRSRYTRRCFAILCRGWAHCRRPKRGKGIAVWTLMACATGPRVNAARLRCGYTCTSSRFQHCIRPHAVAHWPRRMQLANIEARKATL